MKREWACAVWLLAGVAAAEEKPVPSYGDADLERVKPLRGQTGVLSEVAAPAAGPRELAGRPAGRDEAYWRSEAEKVRASVQKLRASADATRGRLDAARDAAREAAFKAARATTKAKDPAAARPAAEARIAALESELKRLTDEIRLRQDELEDRARRARALPGWLR